MSDVDYYGVLWLCTGENNTSDWCFVEGSSSELIDEFSFLREFVDGDDIVMS